MNTTKNVDKKILTPMLLQYLEIKEQYPNDIVVFRVGDFYEAYFEDALPYSQICGFTLTGKTVGQKTKKSKNIYTGEDEKYTYEQIDTDKNLIPMAGVPYHAINEYAQKIIQAGYRLVVVEQLEDPKKRTGNKILKRGIVSILTSMDKDGEFIAECKNNWICSIYNDGNNFSICFTDILTSDIYITNVDSISSLLNEIFRFKPSEIIVNDDIALLLGDKIEQTLKLKTMMTVENSIYKVEDLTGTILNSLEIESLDDLEYNSILNLKSLYIMIKYIDYTKMLDFDFSKEPVFYTANNFMSIDLYSRHNLELTESLIDNSKRGTLLSVLDLCKTSMGSRMLVQWLDNPLLNKAAIENRLDGVSELVSDKDILKSVHESLSGILDISRILGRLKLNRAIPRDLVNLRDSLERLPEIKKNLGRFNTKILYDLFFNMSTFEDLAFLLKNSLLDNPASDIKEGLVLKAGYNKGLDDARDMIENSNRYLQELEEKERARTGIKNLKVVNKNGVCSIEVTNVNTNKVPSDYRIEKALKTNTRYTTDEVVKLEKELFTAIERSKLIEIDLYEEIKSAILSEHKKLAELCDVLAVFDILCGFATVAIENGYTRPSLNTDGKMSIVGGRHPVVEKMQGSFVPNDTNMDMTDNRFLLITGPNMAGKSTYMRQVALITVMAHIGSFVPAMVANIPLVDKIFTRIGASDDISSGRSTYMVEMTEVKNILDNATSKSLVILDEVGRGTSTSDGLSIAQAVSEYIYNTIKCKTLFATHYHELIALEKSLKGLKNYHMAVKKDNGTLEFVRKLEQGGLSESYGIDVAKLAGLPISVIDRAWHILSEIENNRDIDVSSFDKNEEDKIMDTLKKVDKSNLSPTMAYYILSNILNDLEK